MYVQVSPPSVNQSFENDKEPPLKIDEPEVGEDQFYDAGENGAHNSSGVSTDLNFSVANEDLPTDGSDHSVQNTLTPAPRQKRNIEPTLDNLDDISTEGPSSVDGSNSPVDDGLLIEGSITALSSTSEHNTDAVSQPSSTDTVHQYSAADDFSQDKADESHENVPSHDDNAINDSKSSMEVMEDESDCHSSKRNAPEKVVSTDANENADVSTGVDSSTENSGKLISETATLDSALTDKEVVPQINEILTMEDSDVDESLQENLDVAIKVVEESESSVRTSTTDEPETSAKIDDATNEDLLKESTSKSENILEEFQEDAVKINGDSSEILDSRLCSCRVVLFRIDFDENAVKYLKHQTETVQSSSDGNFDSSLDSSFSTPTKLSPPKRRVLTKAARKMIPPAESSKTPSPRARNVRTSATTESARSRRNTRNTSAQDSKPAYFDSVNTDDEAASANISSKRKAVANTTRRTGRPRKTPYPERTSQRNDVDEAENIENELSVDLSFESTLKCVSVPIITDIIHLLGEKTCSELMTLIEQKENVLPSRITKSKIPKSTTTARSSRRRKLSPSDTSKSSVEDDDCKTSGKMGRYDIGISTDENSSLRSEAKSTSNKRSCRQNARVRNYAEDSDESPLKKATTSRRNLTRAGRNEKRVIDSDDENTEDSPKAKSVSNKRSSRASAKVRNYLETSKSDDEAALKKEGTSGENSICADDNEKNNSASDEEKTEDLPKVKSASNKRSSRKCAKVRNSESDNSPLKKETSNENSIDVTRSEQNDTDTDDEKRDLPKPKSTTNKRTSRKRANIQYHTEDSESDDESQLKEKRSRRNSNRMKHNEKNDTDSDDEKVEDSPKMKSTSSRRSSRKSTKVQNYVEDSENDDESPPKEKKSKKTSTHSKHDEKNDIDSDDNNAEDLPKVKSTSSKGTSKKSLKVQDRVEDSKSDDESSLKEEETTEENSTHIESSEKQVTGSDDQNVEDSSHSRFWESVKAQNDVEDSQSDDKSPLEKEETSRRNSTHKEGSVKNDTSSDDEKPEDSPEAKSTSNERSSRVSAKVRKYVGDSESDDEGLSKKTKTSRRNSIYTDSEDEKAEDSSSEIENWSSWKENGLSSSKTRTRT